MHFPEDLLYTKDHEWIRIEGERATVGITAFAQNELGDIVYVEIETLDQSIERNGIFGTVEAVKTVSDLFMPLAGTVTGINPKLADQPELVNSDPYGEGWMVKIRLEEGTDAADLLSAEDYAKMVGNG
ncbi:MAG: glycine cleavage system protein GcvH [Bacteroidia bacterium]|nr:glycine cleavage system protein GcvH [Bacteroidia bacterium]